MRRRSLGVLAAGLSTGCLEPSACTAHIEWGLRVQVRDSVTGIPAGVGATVIAVDGSYNETLRSYPELDSLTFYGAGEREGTYLVRVTKDGYRTWSRSGIVVRDGGCHVIPVTVQASLQPSP